MHLFGVTAKILPYAQDYTGITAFGIPFLILTTGGNHLIRADRSPTYSMTCMLTGAIINTILDPLFIFGFHWGIKGAAWATVIGQTINLSKITSCFSVAIIIIPTAIAVIIPASNHVTIGIKTIPRVINQFYRISTHLSVLIQIICITAID